jgi:hypothetical protein
MKRRTEEEGIICFCKPKNAGARPVKPLHPETGSSDVGGMERGLAGLKSDDKIADNTMRQRLSLLGLGLFTSLLPMLTSSADSRTTPDIHRKPASGAHISHSSLATIATARTSEDTKSDGTSSYLHRGTGSTTPLSSDQISPFSETTPYEFPSRDELGKVPAMPSSPPPPPRPKVLRKTSTPPRIPAVTATQATPPAGTRSRDRSPAAERPPSRANKPQPNRLQPLHGPPTHNAHGRSVSVQQPTTRGASADSPRVVSNPIDSRLQSMQSGEGNSLGTTEKKKVKKSWFPGGRSKHSPDELAKTHETGAWLISPDNRADYSTVPLLNGDPVCSLHGF